MLSSPCFSKPNIILRCGTIYRAILIWGLISFLHVSNGLCTPVDLDSARIVAQNTLHHHLKLYGEWNGTTTPSVGTGEAVAYQGQCVAYNFTVIPSGHVLVATDDTLSPVPLYSTRSTFHPDLADRPKAIESWIVPEQHIRMQSLDRRRRAIELQTGAPSSNERIARAWDFYTDRSVQRADQATATTAASEKPAISRSATVGPVLSSQWGQSTPFNLLTPADTGCSHTLTGCVATAWAQVLNYWQWPNQGIGSHSYTWSGQTISADFSAGTYDWSNMVDDPDGTNDTENAAISKLMYDMAVASQTDYGCTESSSEMWADDVLDLFFRYKAMTFHDRMDSTAEEWFNLFKTELDATPPRPVIFSIFADQGGHEVVVDGYQNDTTNMVHINFGWPDLSYDGYYDVTDDADFDVHIYDWYVDEQYIVTNIEPNENATLPVVIAGNNQTVDERTIVTLIGSATHAGHTITTYQWRRVGNAQFQITNNDQAGASFTAPSVAADTQIVFRLKVVDDARNVGYDECTVTVRDIDATTPPTTLSGDGGGGGGGCFMGALN